MKTYADYEFYATEYRGTNEEDKFECAIIHASQYIRHVTFGRSDNSTCEELKYASCALVDAYISAYNLDGENAAGQKKSENTDGYSVSYVVQATDGESSEELFERKASKIVRKWLLKTGLLNRRVVFDCADEF